MHRYLYFSSRLGLGLLALLVVLGMLTTSLLLAQHSSHAAGVVSSSISVGNEHSLALKPDGTVWAWGNNGGGALGDGTTTERHSPVQVLAGACSGCGTFLTGITAVSAGAGHSLALKSDGTVWAWGYNAEGQLGNNTTTNSTTPVQVLAGACAGCRMTAITAGNQFSLALRSDGTVYGWGSNANGQLGDNTITQRNTPVQVLGVGGTGFLTGIIAINTASSANHSLAVASDGTVYAWGYNSNGQLGDNTTTDRHTPVQVLGVGGMGHLSGINAVAAGGLHSLALNSSGGIVWSWGGNGLGSLGDGTSTQRLTPVQVVGVGGTGILTGVSGISAGVFHSLALKSDGTVWAWGYNAMGQLGDNDAEINSTTPVQVLAGACSVCGTYLTGITAIAAGIDFSLALRSDGTVYAWGMNDHGQLGDNTTTARATPVQSGIELSPTLPNPPPGLAVTAFPLSGKMTFPVADFVAVVTDTDLTAVPSQYTATIDWGDGNRSTTTVDPHSNGQPDCTPTAIPVQCFDIFGQHTYRLARTYAYIVTVTKVLASGQIRRASVASSASISPLDYLFELKAWIPQARVVDPEAIKATPFAIFQPDCANVVHPPHLAFSEYQGDDHAGYEGSYRVLTQVRVQWDGEQFVSLVQPSSLNYDEFGTTHRIISENRSGKRVVCVEQATATCCVTATQTGPTSFDIGYSTSNPLVGPALTIDGVGHVSINASGYITVTFQTDGFPSHGLQVTREGTTQITAILNDVSCLSQEDVLGPAGFARLSLGLGGRVGASGTVTIAPTDVGRAITQLSALC